MSDYPNNGSFDDRDRRDSRAGRDSDGRSRNDRDQSSRHQHGQDRPRDDQRRGYRGGEGREERSAGRPARDGERHRDSDRRGYSQGRPSGDAGRSDGYERASRREDGRRDGRDRRDERGSRAGQDDRRSWGRDDQRGRTVGESRGYRREDERPGGRGGQVRGRGDGERRPSSPGEGRGYRGQDTRGGYRDGGDRGGYRGSRDAEGYRGSGERRGYRGGEDRRSDRAGDDRRGSRGGDGRRGYRGGDERRQDSRGGSRDDFGRGPRQDRFGREEREDFVRPGLAAREDEPETPTDIDEKDLPFPVRAELRGLPKDLGQIVAAHLVAAGELIDEDPALAYRHAEAARRRAARLPVVREATAETAYAAGEYAVALNEYRAMRRMTGGAEYLPVLADCERALGRPQNALKLAREAEREQLDATQRVEMLLVEAGARADMGQQAEAVRLLKRGISDMPGNKLGQARMRYAYADLLEDAGDTVDARKWFVSALKHDTEQTLDAQDRINALDGFVLEVDESEEGYEETDEPVAEETDTQDSDDAPEGVEDQAVDGDEAESTKEVPEHVATAVEDEQAGVQPSDPDEDDQEEK